MSEEPGDKGFAARLMAFGAECSKLPVLDPRASDEIIGYDENGTLDGVSPITEQVNRVVNKVGNSPDPFVQLAAQQTLRKIEY